MNYSYDQSDIAEAVGCTTKVVYSAIYHKQLDPESLSSIIHWAAERQKRKNPYPANRTSPPRPYQRVKTPKEKVLNMAQKVLNSDTLPPSDPESQPEDDEWNTSNDPRLEPVDERILEPDPQ